MDYQCSMAVVPVRKQGFDWLSLAIPTTVHPEPVEGPGVRRLRQAQPEPSLPPFALSLSKGLMQEGFDRLSPNGNGG
jgi:hypothetical protein